MAVGLSLPVEDEDVKFSVWIFPTLLGMGIAIAIALAAPAQAGEAADSGLVRHHHPAHRHAHRAIHAEAIAPNATAQVPPSATAPILFPAARPYPNGQGDEDGLSRDINDCNKGCIGGNPG